MYAEVPNVTTETCIQEPGYSIFFVDSDPPRRYQNPVLGAGPEVLVAQGSYGEELEWARVDDVRSLRVDALAACLSFLRGRILVSEEVADAVDFTQGDHTRRDKDKIQRPRSVM